MARPTHALKKCRDPAWGTDLTDQIHVTDVDPELERGRGDERLELSFLEALLRVEAELLGETSMMGGDGGHTETLLQIPGYSFSEPSRIHEDESRAVALDQRHQALVDFGPDLSGHHGFQRRARNLQPEVQLAEVALVDDRAVGCARFVHPASAHEETRDLFDRVLRGRKPDP